MTSFDEVAWLAKAKVVKGRAGRGQAGRAASPRALGMPEGLQGLRQRRGEQPQRIGALVRSPLEDVKCGRAAHFRDSRGGEVGPRCANRLDGSAVLQSELSSLWCSSPLNAGTQTGSATPQSLDGSEALRSEPADASQDVVMYAGAKLSPDLLTHAASLTPARSRGWTARLGCSPEAPPNQIPAWSLARAGASIRPALGLLSARSGANEAKMA
eukprot:CAMPEP_0197914520 /NCGR_PEP_ID=MMETSP1439-20131203/78656_1 /TAXON_ID=66791 /ORGANISM="Gonyaulax spinifera, Strain CCMP409" /LENGTH=212 /DNA_ID=CAMNT_0043536431 /DNA_START=257 /DNA_END=897 /DNA_ORIENTATION=+